MTSEPEWNDLIDQLKAVAEPGRLRILLALARVDELCLCQFSQWLGLTDATVSRHIAQLLRTNWIHSRKQGRWVFYQMAPERREWLHFISKSLSPSWLDEQHRQIDAIFAGTLSLCGFKPNTAASTLDDRSKTCG